MKEQKIAYYTNYNSPIGDYTIACNELKNSIIGIWLDSQKYHGRERYNLIKDENIKILKDVQDLLKEYFNGNAISYEKIKLNPEGTDFQKLIWSILEKIDYASTKNYKEIAEKAAELLGRKSMSAQAVGRAIGKNPISILIPCHRVVSVDGSLTGYSGGLENKAFLLKLEQKR